MILFFFLLFFPSCLTTSPFTRLKNIRSQYPGFNVSKELNYPFTTVFNWRKLDFNYHTFSDRQKAIYSGEFIAENAVPLGLAADIRRNRIFVSIPRWKNGVPATLTSLKLNINIDAPLLDPYPSWMDHSPTSSFDCNRIISVYRMHIISECDQLWIIDSGVINATIGLRQLCPPKIIAIDLTMDRIISSYDIPSKFIRMNSLFTNILIEPSIIKNGVTLCSNPTIYIPDTWGYGLLVYMPAKKKSWLVQSPMFQPNPIACFYDVSGIQFEWPDGIFGVTLSPWIDEAQNRILFFHAMSSFAVRFLN